MIDINKFCRQNLVSLLAGTYRFEFNIDREGTSIESNTFEYKCLAVQVEELENQTTVATLSYLVHNLFILVICFGQHSLTNTQTHTQLTAQ